MRRRNGRASISRDAANQGIERPAHGFGVAGNDPDVALLRSSSSAIESTRHEDRQSVLGCNDVAVPRNGVCIHMASSRTVKYREFTYSPRARTHVDADTIPRHADIVAPETDDDLRVRVLSDGR